jgi:hypothetical protein
MRIAQGSDLTGDYVVHAIVPPGLDRLLADQAWVDYLDLGCRIDVLHSPILEPFKVRHITASPAAIQRDLHDLQAAIHSAMTRLPAFQLSHETPSADLLDLANLYLAPHLQPGDAWVSGDYTASTDNLDPEVSEIAAEELCSAMGLGLKARHLFIAGLTRHRFEGRPQTWGQLMGSVISFPVLCIANLALTLTAFQLAGRRYHSVAKPGVLVNGDDVGFPADGWTRYVWRLVTSSGGLSPSVGKNFVSREFLQLNSQMLHWRPNEVRVARATGPGGLVTSEKGLFGLTPCPQLAVLAPPPEDNKGAVGYGKFLAQAPTLQREYLDGFSGVERDRQNRLWLATWSAELDRLQPYSAEINWFLPRVLGGFGLEPPGDFVVQANEGQLRAAAYLRDHTDLETWDRVRPGLSGMPAATLGHDDARGLLSLFKRFVEPVWSDRPEPGPLAGIETALAFAGTSGYWFPRPAKSGVEQPRVCMRIRAMPGGFELTTETQPDKPPPSLVRWARLLRTFARKTPRVMELDRALSFRKHLVLRMRSGATFGAGGLITDVRRLLTTRLPVTPSQSQLALELPLGTVVVGVTPRHDTLLEDAGDDRI